MAKKKSSLKNRVARCGVGRGGGMNVAALLPEAPRLSIGEVCWKLLRPGGHLEVADAPELTGRLFRTFTSSEATGWVVGALACDLAYGSSEENDLMDDPKLRSLENDVIEALGPDAHWYSNGDHPLPMFRSPGDGRSWHSVTDATFDLLLAVRGNGLDLVLYTAQED
ncbi:hypothetical protein [Streptomyces sp. NBC_00344]|uniref:hypothetical protein n=1 Tax=Streptomyces sp. NBC_00344 TaxID=2975720 RepID=UPI002E1DB445